MEAVRIIPAKDYDRFLRVVLDAYPGFGSIETEQDFERIRRHFEHRNMDPRVSNWGYYRNGRLLAGMRFFDFQVTLRGTLLPAGGGGVLAVDLLHKKEHIAKRLIGSYFRHYRRRGFPLAMLWPFRHDFYRNMGCGNGGNVHIYKFRPSALPVTAGRKHVRFLTSEDVPQVTSCYNRYAARNNGMVQERPEHFDRVFETNKKRRWLGYVRGGKLLGYLCFGFARGNPSSFVDNHINVNEIVCDSPEAFAGLMAFLRSQLDQISWIRVLTFDDSFHCFLPDPRNDTGNLYPEVWHESHVSAAGTMYRVLNTPALFDALKAQDFGGVSCRLKLTVRDSFLRANHGSTVVHFVKGHPRVKSSNAASQVELKLGVADLSALIMGAADLRALRLYGLATLSDDRWLERLNRLFAVDHRPRCMTQF